jgi:hypothetical protein
MKMDYRLLFGLVCYALLAFWGCGSKDAGPEKSGRYLYFTADVPAGMYWNVVVDFTSKGDNILCKTMSPITGKAIPKRKSETYPLAKSGDTAKAALFRDKLSPCEWELSVVSLEDRGDRCIQVHTLLLNEEDGSYSGDSANPDPYLPDSLAFTCVLDTSNGCEHCKETSGEVNLSYRMRQEPITRFHIGLATSKPSL